MIKNSSKSAESQQKVTDANVVTRLALGSDVRCGFLVSSHDIRIDGRFFGTVVTKGKLILGEKGCFKGDIVCTNADIYGKMDGNIVSGDLLSLMSTSRFKGVIKINRLGVENGAQFDGNCQLLKADEFQTIFEEYEKRAEKEFSADSPEE
ncbi:MAG: polymer-forming cytoskeletal protein [Bacteroidales bacterium]|nr:polymer-forming cytoskeletal protein [Candidatus Cacconaster merdequi]